MFLFEFQAVLFSLAILGACSLTDSTSSNYSTNLAGNSSTQSLAPFHNSTVTNATLASPTSKSSSISTGAKQCATTACRGAGNFTTGANSSLAANSSFAANSSLGANVTDAATSAIYTPWFPDYSYVSGWSAALSCYSTVGEIWNDCFSLISAFPFAYTQLYTATYTATAYSTFTLCDGWPRVDAIPVTTWITLDDPEYYFDGTGWTTYGTTTITWEKTIPAPAAALSTYYVTSVDTVVYVSDSWSCATGPDCTSSWACPPTPDCQIEPTDCMSLMYSSFNAQFTATQSNNPFSLPVLCDTMDDLAYSEIDGLFPCTISVPTVQLLYWPVTLASQDLCHFPFPIDITAAPNNSFTPIAVAYGMTITSDENCYLSYAPLTVWSITVGAGLLSTTDFFTLPSGILTVPSSELQSYRAWWPGLATADTFSFNFADLLPNHVPILAYEGQTMCVLLTIDPVNDPLCATIFEEFYAPQLAYPTQFMELDPRLSSCIFDYDGLYDPPTSLVPAGWLIAPTTSAGGGDPPITSGPATPGPTGQLYSPPLTVSFSQVSTEMDEPGDPGLNGDAKIGSDTAITASTNNQGTVVVAGQTLSAGGPVATLSGGEVLSAAAAGGAIVVLQAGDNGAVASTISLSPISTMYPTQVTAGPPSAVFTFGGELMTASPAADGGLLINNTPLPQGVIATVGGVQIWAAAGGTAVILVSKGVTQTIPLTNAGFGGLVTSADPSGKNSVVEGVVIAIGSAAFTAYESVANGSAVVVIGEQTLTVGGSPITLLDGETVSARASESLLVGGGKSSVRISTGTFDGSAFGGTESLTFDPIASTTGIAPPSSSTHKKNDGQRINMGWSSVMAEVLVCILAAL